MAGHELLGASAKRWVNQQRKTSTIRHDARKPSAGTTCAVDSEHTSPISSTSICSTSCWRISQRRAQAVVQYLASKFNVPPHKFYLIGIGKDQEVATNKTAAGRAQNRRVEVQILSNAAQTGTAVSQVR